MSKISINDIAGVLVHKNGLDKNEAESFVTSIFETLQKALEEEGIVKIKGLGTFKIIGVEARESVNINTGERVVIERHGKITFTPDNTMKELVNKPFSQFETVVLNEGVEFDDMKEDKDESSFEKETQEENEISNDDIIETNYNDVENNRIPSEMQISEPENSTDLPNEEDTATIIDETEAVESPLVDNDTNRDDKTESKEDHADESIVIDDDVESAKENTSYNRVLRWSFYIIISLLFICMAFGAGYYFAMQTIDSDTDNNNLLTSEDIKQKSKADTSIFVSDSVQHKADTLSRKDSLSTSKSQEIQTKDSSNQGNATTSKEGSNIEKDIAEKEFDSSIYDNMDNRVRTGAYRIIGTDFEKIVKKGETLQGISRQFLGEGMSCYIEVYNGFDKNTELKAGQKIKIPKLELKKKRRITTAN